MSATYCITAAGGTVLHTVAGAMDDHRPWQDTLTTVCGRRLVASNYFTSLADYRRSYNAFGQACAQCATPAPPDPPKDTP